MIPLLLHFTHPMRCGLVLVNHHRENVVIVHQMPVAHGIEKHFRSQRISRAVLQNLWHDIRAKVSSYRYAPIKLYLNV